MAKKESGEPFAHAPTGMLRVCDCSFGHKQIGPEINLSGVFVLGVPDLSATQFDNNGSQFHDRDRGQPWAGSVDLVR